MHDFLDSDKSVVCGWYFGERKLQYMLPAHVQQLVPQHHSGHQLPRRDVRCPWLHLRRPRVDGMV